MCTCFVSRQEDLLIAMNFDNNGLKFELNNKENHSFIVEIYTERGKNISFGMNSKKTFVNDMVVDSNGKGFYKRVNIVV